MAEITYTTIFQLRRGSSVEWESVDPILREGEPGWDTTLKKMKVGDGVTPWNELDFMSNDVDVDSLEIDVINCGDATIS